jgi:hypothetical protein
MNASARIETEAEEEGCSAGGLGGDRDRERDRLRLERVSSESNSCATRRCSAVVWRLG